MEALPAQGTTDATVTDDGMVIQVPNKALNRLIRAGVAAERRERERTARRKAQRAARRQNRK